MLEALEKFVKNNPCSEISESENHYYIKKPWGDESFKLKLKKEKDWNFFNNLFFPNELSAIFHVDKNLYEFIFMPIAQDYRVLSRKFDFIFNQKIFKTYFDAPTNIFVQIASAFREVDSSDTNYRNLHRFRDFYNQEGLQNFVKRYFKDKKPINFFIEGPFNEVQNHIALFKELNIHMQYFDRKMPVLLFYDTTIANIEKYNVPCLNEKDGFPQTINLSGIDSVLLDLITTATYTSNIRMKYIFYYQVLEYCAYYHINNDLKRNLTNIMKNPDISDKADKYVQNIIEEFKDFFKQNDDSMKLERLISDFCNISDIKNEIESNCDYFTRDVEFEGGFKILKLFDSKDNIDKLPPSVMKDIKANIEKIRNVLVHVRESRENKVIHPTTKNNSQLIPYLYIVRRIAELISFRYK